MPENPRTELDDVLTAIRDDVRTLATLRANISRLRASIAALTADMNRDHKEFGSLSKSLLERLKHLDVTATGNYGFEGRIIDLLTAIVLLPEPAEQASNS